MGKLIFVTGGSASGKTSIAESMKKALGKRALLVSQDMFYNSTNGENTNYDLPSAFDWDLQFEVLSKLNQGKEVDMPIYSFEEHKRVGYKKVQSAEIIIFEGLFSFWHDKITAMANFLIYIDTPSDTRLARRILRDVTHRGRDPLNVVDRWLKDVQPSFKKYINPVKEKADVIVPWTHAKPRSILALLTIVNDI